YLPAPCFVVGGPPCPPLLAIFRKGRPRRAALQRFRRDYFFPDLPNDFASRLSSSLRSIRLLRSFVAASIVFGSTTAMFLKIGFATKLTTTSCRSAIVF